VAQSSLETIGPALARPVRTSAAGTLGILGGLALLVALVVEIPAALNGLRIVSCVGVIAGTGVAWILVGVDLLVLGRARALPSMPDGRAEASA